MALLKTNTFPASKEGQLLLGKVKTALKNLSGQDAKDGNYRSAPYRLNPSRDFLKSNYRLIWAECTIEFDSNEPGASIKNGRQIKIGPFFLQRRFSVMDVEKLILHEYLHAAINIEWKEAHHGIIDQVIKENLRYPGPANIGENVF